MPKIPAEQGGIKTAVGANAAAGSEAGVITVPTNARWKLLSYYVKLVQGATQTPRPALLIRDENDATVAIIPMGADLAASTTVDLTWGAGIPNTANNVDLGSMATGLPVDMVLLQGWDIITTTQGIGANTNYGVPRAAFQEWIEE